MLGLRRQHEEQTYWMRTALSRHFTPPVNAARYRSSYSRLEFYHTPPPFTPSSCAPRRMRWHLLTSECPLGRLNANPTRQRRMRFPSTHNATCDACQAHPILKRHRCTSCPDYDLCAPHVSFPASGLVKHIMCCRCGACVVTVQHDPSHSFREVSLKESAALSADWNRHSKNSSLRELQAVAIERGIKKAGVSWAKSCPPKGRKEDVLRRLRADSKGLPLVAPAARVKPKKKPEKQGLKWQGTQNSKLFKFQKGRGKLIAKMLFAKNGRSGFTLYSTLRWDEGGKLRPAL